MTLIDISLLNTTIQLSCTPGEEDHLQRVAKMVQQRLAAMKSQQPKASDSMLLATVALIMEDEILKLKSALQTPEQAASEAYSTLEKQGEGHDMAVGAAINAIADYVEALANKYEQQKL